MKRISVKLKNRNYTVSCGTGQWEEELLIQAGKQVNKHGRIFVVYDAKVLALYGQQIAKVIKRSGRKYNELVLPSGEQTKSTSQLNRVYSYLLDNKIARDDFLLACGGGVTSDFTGYVAATILRGIKWGVLSTTLLGMVDASIGGKTGINHKYGKNLIGAFWQPSFVICDTIFINTLSSRLIVAGLGEVLKYAGLIGKAMNNLLDRYHEAGNLYDPKYLNELVYMSAKYKADIVSRDEREGNLRMVLNLGHTFGHAIEKSLGYGKLQHGEAVIIGLLAAIELSERTNKKRIASLADYKNTIKQFLGLIPFCSIDISDVIAHMGVDKKRKGNKLLFVLLDKPGRPIISDVNNNLIRPSFSAALKEYELRR
ncbi:MAG: 3-dehydroquinate synthase [bacterium]